MSIEMPMPQYVIDRAIAAACEIVTQQYLQDQPMNIGALDQAISEYKTNMRHDALLSADSEKLNKLL